MKKTQRFALGAALALLSTSSLSFAETLSEKWKEKMESVREEIPAIGLIADEITYDGLKICDFHFDTQKKYTIVKPGQKISAEFDYALNSDCLENLELHHFIYGLHPYGPLGCVIHSLGLMDREGHTKIEFEAPKEKGVYQLRFCHSRKKISHTAAHKEWSKNTAPSNTIVGVVVVD